jgi:CO/xanthine dehydrogenase Mo-binding subunit
MNPRTIPELENFQEEFWNHSLKLTVDRRNFLRLLGGGMLICLAYPQLRAQESGRFGGGHELPKDIAAWLHIDADGNVKVFTGKVEVGQNIRTSLAQQVAEELHVPFESISMVMGDTALTPWDMGTFGSRTTPTMGPQLRTMAAAAKQMLIEMAADRWHVPAGELKAVEGKVVDKQNSHSVAYGELTRGENLVKVVSGSIKLTPASEWKIADTPVPKVDGRKFVTGEHKFPSDIVRPEMLYGAVLRPDGFNATLASLDSSAAEKVPGVTVVHEGDFVGVAAADDTTVQEALGTLRAKWNVPAQISNSGLFEYLKKNGASDDDTAQRAGSVEQALVSADVKVERNYTVQYIAHTPLEPRAAVAEWNNGSLTVWTGTQRPFGVREELAQAFNIPESKVRVIQPDMGSGYGGKHTGETAIEAARLAKAAGKPVKVVWTRTEEFTWAYFRPAALIEVKAGARKDGTLVAWEFHNYNSGSAALGTPYEVPNQLVHYHPVRSPLRQGSYRSLAGAANNFARESHMDAIAHAAGIDPLELRLKNLQEPRLRAVLEAVAEKCKWKNLKSSPERGFGIACGTDKGGYVATIAEVQIDQATKRIRISRVVQAWESGAVINPNGIRNQLSGAIVQAIGGAMFETIRFGDGCILNPHFASYPVPRFRDTPEIDLIVLDRKDLPSAGAGEIGLIGLAPAVGNAIFAATGVRIANMPMLPRTAVPGEPSVSFKS